MHLRTSYCTDGVPHHAAWVDGFLFEPPWVEYRDEGASTLSPKGKLIIFLSETPLFKEGAIKLAGFTKQDVHKFPRVWSVTYKKSP